MKLTGKLTKESKSLNAAISPRAGGGRVKDVVYGSASGESLVNSDGVAIIPPYPPMPTIPVKGVMQGQTNLVDNNGIARVPEFPAIPASNKNLYGVDTPNSSIGNNGDLYFKYINKIINRVDYIETNGGNKAQCIKTGVAFDTSSQIYIDCIITDNIYSNYQGIIGWRDNQPYFGLYTRVRDRNVFAVDYMNTSTAVIADDPPIYNNRIMIYADATHWTWSDGINNYSQDFTFSETTQSGLNLGSVFFSGAANSEQGKYKIYDFKHYKNGELVQHLIPIIENGVPCMFDRITNNTLYNNNPSTPFLYGGTPTEENIKIITNKYIKMNNEWYSF